MAIAPGRRVRTAIRVALALAVAALVARRAEAFRPLITFDDALSVNSLTVTPRWSAEPFVPPPGAAVPVGTGLHDGLQVCVAPHFAEDLGATTAQQIEEVETATLAAFAAWQSPVLSFDVDFDCYGGDEVVLATFSDSGSPYFGLTTWTTGGSGLPVLGTRVLTNGQSSFGYVIAGALIRINLYKVLPFRASLSEAQQLAGLQRLIMHEVGHAIGLDHPTGALVFTPNRPNLDLDANPFNAMVIDWLAPFASFIASPNYDPEAIMMRGPPNLSALLYTELRNDDRAGRDVLYPLPPPDTDADGVLDANDVCPLTPDPAQTDSDSDGVGDACALAAGDVLFSGYVTPIVPTQAPTLLLLPPSGPARPMYAPAATGAGLIRAAPFRERMIAASVPRDPTVWDLRLVDIAHGDERTVLSPASRALDLEVDALGRILAVVDEPPPTRAAILRIDPVNGASTPIESGLSKVGAIALDTDGTSVIASVADDAVGSSLRLYPASGGLPSDFASFAEGPRAIAVEGNGDVAMAVELPPNDAGVARVSRASGLVTLLASGFSGISGIAVATNGDILVSWNDLAGSWLLTRVNPVTGGKQLVPVSGFATDFIASPALSSVPAFAPDPDLDGVLGAADDCPYARNPDQRDSDGRGGGDVCDACPLDAGDGCSAARTAASSISTAGGALTTPDGNVTVQIPAGALPGETSVSITDTGTELELAGLSIVIKRAELGPEGQAFTTPVTVVLRWDDVNNDGLVDQPSDDFPVMSELDLHLLRNGAPTSQPCGVPQHTPGTCTTSCCDRAANQWTLQVNSFSEYRLEGGADADYDGVPTATDNCPFVHDPTQADPGGVASYGADGIGTVCQCGDANGSGVVDAMDVSAIREALTGAGLGLASPGKCNVRGPVDPLVPLDSRAPHDCAIDDVVSIRRAILAYPPALGKNCAGAPNIL